ncbi:PAS domain-containing protein, partial [Enterococcus faecium]|uniref:PAS domain-containing protein n=1 Tax=Enterococcus faecium TaxID=1352 RepID=UPI003F4256E6
DLFLVNACIRGVHEMRDVAQRQAELEVTNCNIEQTVRERTEELQYSEENLRTVLEAIPAGVTLLARDGTVLWMNQTGLKLMGAF